MPHVCLWFIQVYTSLLDRPAVLGSYMGQHCRGLQDILACQLSTQLQARFGSKYVMLFSMADSVPRRWVESHCSCIAQHTGQCTCYYQKSFSGLLLKPPQRQTLARVAVASFRSSQMAWWLSGAMVVLGAQCCRRNGMFLLPHLRYSVLRL